MQSAQLPTINELRKGSLTFNKVQLNRARQELSELLRTEANKSYNTVCIEYEAPTHEIAHQLTEELKSLGYKVSFGSSGSNPHDTYTDFQKLVISFTL